MINLQKLADDLNLTIVERRGAHRSGYAPNDQTIVLKPGMRGRVLRSVLAHEIGHHVLGHRPTEFGLIRSRQERSANEWAARFLIDIHSYREVEHLRDGNVPTMAHDLNVTPELVIAYQGTLERIGTSVYVRPRMGAGQWEQCEDVMR